MYQKILAPSVLLGLSGDLEYSQARTSTFLLPLSYLTLRISMTNSDIAKKQNLNPTLKDGERMMKRRRGRPRKSADENPDDVRSITKSIRYSPKEWKEVEEAMKKKNAKTFNRFAREATMDKRTYIIDSDAAKELRAARKDIINFANAISARKLTKFERRELLLSLPTLKEWWPCIEKVLVEITNFFDSMHEKASVNLTFNKEKTS